MYVAASGTLGQVRDYANARNVNAPIFTRGFGAVLKLRLFPMTDVQTQYPISSLSGIVSWNCVFDTDFNQSTTPKLVADAGEVYVHEATETINGSAKKFTEVVIPISDMNTQELVTLIGNNEVVSNLIMELIGVDGEGNEVFGLQVKGFSVRNRINYGGSPTTIDPEYLTATQARALVASGVVRQFSDDGENWHASQTSDDLYYRERSASDASSAWSSPIALLRGPQGDPGNSGTSTYTYVAYAADTHGTDFSLTPNEERIYRAEIHVNEEIASPTFSDFTDANAVWVQYIWPEEDESSSSSSVSGDMTKAVYDTNNDGKVNSADAADKLTTARKIGNANFDGSANISLSDIGAAPASHTHEISNVSGLQTALNGKAESTHTHSISNVTGLETALEGKAPSSHTHTIANVTGLETALSGKAAASHSHAISDVTGLETALNGKIEGVKLNGESQTVTDKVANVLALAAVKTMPAADESLQDFLLYLGTTVSGDSYVGKLRTYQEQGDGVKYLDLTISDSTATGTSRVWTGFNYLDNVIRIRYDNNAWIIERKYMGEDEPYTQIGTLTSPAANGQPWGNYTVSSSTWTFSPVTACNPATKLHLYERNEAWNADVLFVKYGNSTMTLFRVNSSNYWNEDGTQYGDNALHWNGSTTGYWSIEINSFIFQSPTCESTVMPWELSGQTWTYSGGDEDSFSYVIEIDRLFTGGWTDNGSIVAQGGN